MKHGGFVLAILVLSLADPAQSADLTHPSPIYAPEENVTGRVLPACVEGYEPLVLKCDPRVYLPPGRYYALEDQYLELQRSRRHPYADFFRY